jgi:NAD(P)-dependent dehydrogenase (short-subunit alcohol dehydrogenase family)
MADQRLCVVTGGGSGLGRAISEGLARAGHRVVLLCRDPQRGERARQEIAAMTGNPAVELVVADLAVRTATREAAQAIRERHRAIDVLVHNAGIWPTRLERTDEGLERSFAINHLAPFILNAALADRLGRGSRVVQVTAGLAVKGRVDLDRTPVGGDFHRFRTYANTKLCNLLCTAELARRWAGRGVTVNAVHPGVVRTKLGDMSGPLGLLLRLIKRRWLPPEVGALGPLRLAIDGALDEVSGRYHHQLAEAPWPAVAVDQALARALWDRSVEYADR